MVAVVAVRLAVMFGEATTLLFSTCCCCDCCCDCCVEDVDGNKVVVVRGVNWCWGDEKDEDDDDEDDVVTMAISGGGGDVAQ